MGQDSTGSDRRFGRESLRAANGNCATSRIFTVARGTLADRDEGLRQAAASGIPEFSAALRPSEALRDFARNDAVSRRLARAARMTVAAEAVTTAGC